MVRLVCGWVLVNGLILAPSWINAAVYDAPFAWFSVEAALLAGGVAFLPSRPWARWVGWLAATALVLLAFALFSDLVFYQSLGRPLDLSLDLYLLNAVYRLAVGNLGLVRTLFWMAVIGAAAALCVWGVGWLLRPAPDPRRLRFGLGVAGGVLAMGLLGLVAPGVAMRFPAPAAAFLRTQTVQFRDRREERAAFTSELATDPRAFAETPGLLSRLGERRVVIAYIESYGMAALNDPEFAPEVRSTLQSASARLDSAGIHLATGTFVSPTLGGQSWYAHGTMLSGLWLSNQLRYGLLLTSERETLVDDFRRAGYRTATVMPAITTPWPEAVRIGYDEVHTSQNMPYVGPPFYWVTMPDQFTWSFLGSLLREASAPTFVEVGMVSSHAPWTPVLPLVDWDIIGDGAVFEPYRVEGDPPEELWWDVPALRTNYRRSIVYSLEAMTQFVERYLDERTLMIVVGDHQAAPWVTGSSDPNVPVHVMSRDGSSLEPFREWGFVDGGIPDPAATPHRMDEFRGWFVRAYSGEP
jgi:hypothetical protein